MADEKISDLTDGSPLQDTDEFVVARAGSNVKIPGSAVGGGGAQLLDLGTITAVGLLAGPDTLITPAAGSAFWVFPDPVGFVAIDSGAVDVAPNSRISPTGNASPILQWSAGGTFYNSGFNFNPSTFQGQPIMDGTALKAVYQTNNNAYNVLSTPPAWQALHTYAASLVLIEGNDSHIWSQTAGGISGATEPDFAGNEGGTVMDGTVTWTDEGALPTTGTLHLLGLAFPGP